MYKLKQEIDDSIRRHDIHMCESHNVNVQDVIGMTSQLKSHKHDGNKGHYVTNWGCVRGQYHTTMNKHNPLKV